MLKKILIGLLFLTIISCNKKEDNSHLLSKYIQIDHVIKTGFQFKGMRTGFAFAVYNNQVFLNPVLTNKGLKTMVYNLNNKKFALEFFKLDKSVTDTIMYQTVPDDIEVNKNNIFALFGKYLLVIDKNNSNNTYVTNLTEPYQKLKAFDSTLIIYRAYNFNPLEAKIPVRIAQFDLKSKKITNFVDPVSDAIEFSYFAPSNWIDISQKGEAIFTNTLKPEHCFYDTNLKLNQKLVYTPKNWNNIDMRDLNVIRSAKNSMTPQEIIRNLTKTEDSDGCRVISVNFANDSTLLVFYSAPSKGEKADFVRYCNIWKRKNDKWVLFDKELKDAYPDLETILTKDNFPFTGSFQNLKFDNNKAYYIYVMPNEDKLLQFGKKFEVVKKEMNRHFAEEKLYHQLFIYNCRF